MKVSADGAYLMHHYEQCRLEAYPDPGSKDGHPWTIGWGHTGPEVVKGLKWTQEQADAAFVKDLQKFEAGVMSLLKVAVTQGQFDALVSLAYNIGLDIDADTIAEGLGDSTLLRRLNEGLYAEAAAQFPKWNKNAGKVMRGLTRRRYAEKARFEGKSAVEAIQIGLLAA